MNIFFSDLALEQLENIYNYLRTKSNYAAVVIHNHILYEIERLRDFPQVAPIEPELTGYSHTYRSFIIRRLYKIIYYTEDNTVFISAVFDCRQNPQKLKDSFRH